MVSMYMFAAGATLRLNRLYHVQCYLYPTSPLDLLKCLAKVPPSTPPCQGSFMIDSICIVPHCPQGPKFMTPKWVTSYVISYIAWSVELFCTLGCHDFSDGPGKPILPDRFLHMRRSCRSKEWNWHGCCNASSLDAVEHPIGQ